MQYLYLNNVRGFSNTFVPIEDCNFLVGENSTGKSSFLSLLRAVTSYDFLFQPKFTLGDDDAPASFSDLVFNWSEIKTHFDVGVLYTEAGKDGKLEMSFSIQRFGEADGQPKPTQLIHCRDRRIVHVRFSRTATEYHVDVTKSFNSSNAALLEFKRAAGELDASKRIFKRIPKDFPSYPPAGLALSFINSIEAGGKTSLLKSFKIEFPFAQRLTWFAPIRTKPKRIYHGLSKGYSAEGEHTPFVVRQRLKSKTFVETLRTFGSSSGLFDVVSTHTFGKSKNSPFEILIRLNGRSFNMENVGYGVSQALPLVVEFLSGSDPKTFAVQQPEVHLHPRAQAALGSLVLQLSVERSHRFIIETHSDYLIDRFRLELSRSKKKRSSQVLFFSRSPKGNAVASLNISPEGRYSQKQPQKFRDFFIREEIQLLGL